MQNTKPKMKDVAEYAGVSLKTVSRVLNNEPHVQESVREKVRRAAEALQYIPSRSARSLRSTRSYSISMVCQDHMSAYVNGVQFGALMACQSLGYHLSISLPEAIDTMDVEQIKAMFERMLSHQEPDGVLLVAPFASNPLVTEVLNQLNIPTARIGPVDVATEGVLVQIDDQQAARELTDHLLGLGHTRIAFIRGAEDQRATHERFLGFSEAMKSAGLKVDPELIHAGDFMFDAGVEAAEHLLNLEHRPTAIFAANDDMAAGVVLSAQRMGISVPDDLSVVGFDDSDIATRMWPSLTTVRQDLEELGKCAVTTLIKRLGRPEENAGSAIIQPHEFKLRNSTAPVAK